MAGIIPNDFALTKLKCGNLRILDNGGKIVYISYDNGPLIMQTPEMVAPFGISQWDNDKGGKKSTLDLSFKGKESRPNLERFYENLEALDKKIVSEAFENSPSWFKKKTSEEVLKELYTPILRHAKDKNTGEITNKYPSTFKATLPEKDGKFTFEVYNQKRELVDLNSMELKGAKVTAMIQCLGIWIAGTKFGVSWKILQMRVVPVKKLEGYCFKELDDKVDDEDLKEEENDDDEVMDHAVAKSDDENVVESDEEDDDLEVKTPVVVATKKVVSRASKKA
jgi:hypothetical protein